MFAYKYFFSRIISVNKTRVQVISTMIWFVFILTGIFYNQAFSIEFDNTFGVISGISKGIVKEEADPTKSKIAVDKEEVVADGADFTTVTVTLFNEQGNPIEEGGDTVEVFTETGENISPVPATDNGDGTYTAKLTSSTKVSEVLVLAKLNKVAIHDGKWVSFVAGKADPSKSLIQSKDLQIEANGISHTVITVTLLDKNGNKLSKGGDKVELNTDAGTISAVVDNHNGTYQARLTSSTKLEKAKVTGKLNDANIGSSTIVKFGAGLPDFKRSIITTNKNEIAADGISSAVITVRLFDEFGNPIQNGNAEVTLSYKPENLAILGSIVNNEDGTYTALLTSKKNIGMVEVRGVLDGANMEDSTLVELIAGPPASLNSKIVALMPEISADGVSTTKIDVILYDENDNPLKRGGETVKLFTTAGTLNNNNAKDNFNGTYTSILTSANSVGEATLTGELNGDDIESFATVKFVSDEVIPDRCKTTLEVNDNSLVANGSSQTNVRLKVYDTQGRAINTGGLDVKFYTTMGLLSSVTDNNDGTYTSTLTSPTKTGTGYLKATIDEKEICESPKVEFIVGPITPSKCSVLATKKEINADGVSQSVIVVQLKDEHGNPYKSGGESVELFTDRGSITQNATDKGDGTYEGKLTSSNTPETAVISAKVNNLEIGETTTVEFLETILPDPTQTTVEAKDKKINANGVSNTTITVVLKDKNGNQLKRGGSEVILLTTAGSITFDPVDNNDGSYTGVLTSSKSEETAIVETMVNGVKVNTEVEVQFVKPIIDATQSFIEVAKKEIFAGGVAFTTVKVTLIDEEGNPLTMGGDEVKLFTDAGTITSLPVDGNNGKYTGILTSSKLIQIATLSGEVNGEKIGNQPTVKFIAGEPSHLTSQITSDKKEILSDGKSKAIITLQLYDVLGNKINNGGYKVALSATKGDLSSAKDNNDGSYTAVLISTKNEETAVITGKINDLPVVDDEKVDFVNSIAIDPALCSVKAKETYLLADGKAKTTITITIVDKNGDRLDHGGDDVKLKNTSGTLSDLNDNNDGTYLASLTSANKPDSSVLTASVNGKEILEEEVVYFVNEFPADVKTSIIKAAKPKILADGKSQTKITVTLFDKNGERVTSGGNEVILNYNNVGDLSVLTNNGDGTYVAILTSSNQADTCIITGVLNGKPILDAETVIFVNEVVADPTLTLVVAEKRKVLADGATETGITVQVYDINGNKKDKGGDEVALFTNAGKLTDEIAKDNDDGTYSTSIISPKTAGVGIIGGVLNGDTILDIEKIFFVEKIVVPDPDKCEITSKYSKLPADGKTSSIITAVLYDNNGERINIGGDEVELVTSLGILKLGIANDNGDGTYTDTLISAEIEGVAEITGTVNGQSIKDKAEVTFGFTVVMAHPQQCKITANPTKIKADGKSTSEITIILYDRDGNRLSEGGNLVVMNLPKEGKFDNENGVAKDNGNGTYTLILTSSTIVGAVIIKGTVDGDTIGDSAEIEFFKEIVVNPKASDIESEKTQLLANGMNTSIITVRLYDTKGDQIEVDENIVKLELTPKELGSLGEIKFENGEYHTIFTAGKLSGDVIITGTVNGETIADNAKIELIKENEGEIEVPQGFSPNGDQVNDLLVITGIVAYPQSKLIVFNRWGSKVYEKQGYANDWDGRSMGSLNTGTAELPNGTYFYLLDLGNGTETIKGYIYISR